MISLLQSIYSSFLLVDNFNYKDINHLTYNRFYKNKMLSLLEINDSISFSFKTSSLIKHLLLSLENDVTEQYDRSIDFLNRNDNLLASLKTLKKINDIYGTNTSRFNYTRIYSNFLNSSSDFNEEQITGSSLDSNAYEERDGKLIPIKPEDAITSSTVYLDTAKEKINSLFAEIKDSEGKPVKVKQISGTDSLNESNLLWKFSKGSLQPSYTFAIPPSTFRFLKLDIENNGSPVSMFLKPSLLKYKGSASSFEKDIQLDEPISSISFSIPSEQVNLNEYFSFVLSVQINNQSYKIAPIDDPYSSLPELIIIGPNNGLNKTIFIQTEEPILSYKVSLLIEKRKELTYALLKKILPESSFNLNRTTFSWNSSIEDSGIALPKGAIPESIKVYIPRYLNIGYDNLPVSLGIYSQNHISLPYFIQKDTVLLSLLRLKVNGQTLTYSENATSTTFKILNNKILLDSSYLNSEVFYYIDYVPVNTELVNDGVKVHLPFPVTSDIKTHDLEVFIKNLNTLKTDTFTTVDMARYGNGILYFFLSNNNVSSINSIFSSLSSIQEKDYVYNGENLTNEGDYSFNLIDGIFLIKTENPAAFTIKYYSSFDTFSKPLSYKLIDSNTIVVFYHELESKKLTIPQGSTSYKIPSFSKSQVVKGTVFIPGYFEVNNFNLKRYEDIYLERHSYDSGYSTFLIPYWPVNQSLEFSVIDNTTGLTLDELSYTISGFYLTITDSQNKITSISFSFSAMTDSSSSVDTYVLNKEQGVISFLTPTSGPLPLILKTHNFQIAQRGDYLLDHEILDSKIILKNTEPLVRGQELVLVYKSFNNTNNKNFILDPDTLNIAPRYIDIKTGKDV